MFKQIKSEMVKYPISVNKEMSTGKAMEIMQSIKVRHLPVLEDDQLIGVVSERDLLEGMSKKLCIKDVMTAHPFIVHQDENLKEVLEIMANRKYGSVLIVNDENLLAGIFTTIDALRLLAKFLDSEVEYSKAPRSLLRFEEVVGFY